MNVIVGGSRDFDDYPLLKKWLDGLLLPLIPKGLTLYSGGQRKWTGQAFVGADALAERWAAENKVSVAVYHADWRGKGKAAGPLRNAEMVAAAGPEARAVFFWDGSSPGTADCIARCRRAGLRIKVVTYDSNDIWPD